MARCRMRFGRAVALAKRAGVGPVVGAVVRGGTAHRVDLLLPNGSVVCLHPNGATYPSIFGWASEEEVARRDLDKRLKAFKTSRRGP